MGRHHLIVALLFVNLHTLSFAQQRDATAITLLTQTAGALGVLPSDSTSVGRVTLTAGSLTETGSYLLVTRGTTHTAEHIVMPKGDYLTVYSNRTAMHKMGGKTLGSSFETATWALSSASPGLLCAAILADTDFNLQYVGQQQLNGHTANLLRVWNSYKWLRGGAQFSPMSGRLIWLDAQTGLPLRISLVRASASGAVPTTRFDLTFDDYRTVGVNKFPFSIHESLNGTPWAEITITSVSLNSGVTDADFPLQ